MHSNSFINSIDAINLISFLQFWQFHQFLLILIPSLISLIAIIHITALPTHPTKSLRKIRKNLHNRQTFFTTAGCDSCNNSQLWFHLFVFFPFQCIVSHQNLLVQTAPLNLSVNPLLSSDLFIWLTPFSHNFHAIIPWIPSVPLITQFQFHVLYSFHGFQQIYQYH